MIRTHTTARKGCRYEVLLDAIKHRWLLKGRNSAHGARPAIAGLNNANIELIKGQIHAVIGTNGAGKSTLINLLSGEIPLSSGKVELLGHDVTQRSQHEKSAIRLR
jgi:branched-chain amino acid transport system ATP-binding protein